MAPEMITVTNGYNYKVDIWSIGITAIEIAKGRPPNSEISEVKVVLTICQSIPPRLHGSYSRQFKDFVSMCLNKNPGKRATARVLLTSDFITDYSRRKSIFKELIKPVTPRRHKRRKTRTSSIKKSPRKKSISKKEKHSIKLNYDESSEESNIPAISPYKSRKDSDKVVDSINNSEEILLRSFDSSESVVVQPVIDAEEVPIKKSKRKKKRRRRRSKKDTSNYEILSSIVKKEGKSSVGPKTKELLNQFSDLLSEINDQSEDLLDDMLNQFISQQKPIEKLQKEEKESDLALYLLDRWKARMDSTIVN
eukprot:TRINITY_DN7782_c0_g1_i1.p1 TRINITY_DN7782_c0_g1~~TRINITY_DN7782_c0_g1_i1.p1  ORF type:complete len:308 (+),score=74.23 TRINITY_DN7782_c0_g1_i1:529-1452(+)